MKVRKTPHPPLKVRDSTHAQPGPFRQRLLRQPRRDAMLAQQPAKLAAQFYAQLASPRKQPAKPSMAITV
jgi:hypothetical protein